MTLPTTQQEAERVIQDFANSFRPLENYLPDLSVYGRARNYLINKLKYVECGFCSWLGRNDELEKNGHCPKCQSPTPKKHINYETHTIRKSNTND